MGDGMTKNAEYARTYRQRHPEYRAYRTEWARRDRARKREHLCPGYRYPCMVYIAGDRMLCQFCTRTLALEVTP
jgi:hypothetical protein